MKRSVLGMCGVLLAAVVMAKADVTSVNVVGFNKFTFEKGKLYLVATAFEDIDGKTLKTSDVIGTQLPIGSQIFWYKNPQEGYKTDTRVGSNWGTNIVYHGFMGFWVKVNPTAALASYDVVFKGQVPMESTVSNVVVSGLNMLGFPYTADVAFTNTALYNLGRPSDQMIVYDPVAGYTTYTRLGGGWGATAKALVIKQGQGFWYKSTTNSPLLDVEARPYPKN
ncbi:MAG: hypothetical protein K8T26_15570 [Lentisphaerae bacterium]|nr:hypothetical protein [Lentisphaerota bacterium]